MEPIRVAVFTISDGVAAGTRTDVSGPSVVAWVAQRSFELVKHETLPDAAAEISRRLIVTADGGCDVVITTGGTGLTARDVTPEATLAVIDRNVPGIAEMLRTAGAANTPYAWLSRGVCGVRGRTLIINLPGSESAVRDSLAVLDQIIAHAVQLLRGIQTGQH